jgi:CheY-like chemotaxis protein
MKRQPIDIVIGDWSMPVMSGMALLKWMRSSARHADTPFMMLTAEANPASVRTALEAGVDAYMIKPFTVHSFAGKFMAMIGDVTEPAQAPPSPETIAASAPGPQAAPEASVIGLAPPLAERLKKCTVLIVDDIPTNIEVLAGALKDEYALKVAINGKTALEIANAFDIDPRQPAGAGRERGRGAGRTARQFLRQACRLEQDRRHWPGHLLDAPDGPGAGRRGDDGNRRRPHAPCGDAAGGASLIRPAASGARAPTS